MVKRTNHFNSTSWINHTVPSVILMMLLLLLLWPINCLAEIRNPVLTSTPHSITLVFEPDPAATNYTASFSVYNSPFLNDIWLEPPYNGTPRLNATYYEVSPGLNYTVRLYENETSSKFEVFSETIATVPLAPVNVRVEDSGTTFLNVAWDSIQNITYHAHRIYFRPQNESDYKMLEGTSDELYTLEGLSPGYVYDIYVTAISFGLKESKESRSSNLISIPTLPAPPTNVTAQADNTTHITVTWLPQASSYQDSFEVKYLSQGTNNTALCKDSPCSVVPGPPAGKEIVIYVSSVSHGVLSHPEQVISSTEPDPVADLQAKEGVRSLVLSWKVPQNAAITSYHIRVVNVPDNTTRAYNPEASQGETLVTYTLKPLIGGSLYQVYVAAETPYARGEPETDIFRTSPEPVSNLKGMAINTTAFQLLWQNPNHTVFDNIIIAIEKPDGNILKITEDKTTMNREVPGLIPGETYQVSVVVHTPLSVKISQASNVNITTKPIKPKLVSSTSGEKSISITLTQEEEIGAFSAIEASLPNSSNQQTASLDGVITFTLLTPGMGYVVETVTKSGQENSDLVSFTLYTKPRPPQNLEIEVVNSTSIRVLWEAPDEGGYDNFTVTVEEADGGSQRLVQTTAQLDIEFTGIMAGTTYNVSVVTVKGDQTSSLVKDQNTTAPLGVTDIRVSVRGIDSVTLTWEPPIGSNVEGYALTFDLTNVTLLELPASTTQYKLEGLEPDTNYTIQIFTFALRPADEVKLYSVPKRFNFSTYPESVAAIQKVEASETTINVNWTDPAVGDFNFYALGIKEEISDRQSRPLFLPRTSTNYTFDGLLPGHSYLIAIRTVLRLSSRQERYGILVRLRAVTKPLAVNDLQITTLDTTSLGVSWTTNDTSKQDKFLINYESGAVIKTTEMAGSNSSNEYQMTLDQLLSGSNYQVQVVAVRSVLTDSEDSQPAVSTGFTKPNPVSNFSLSLETDSIITITWTAPSVGGVDDYLVRYRPVLREPDSEFQMATSTLTSKRLVDLFPGEKYQLQVVAVRHGLESEEVNGSIALKPLPPASFTQNKDKTTTNSVTVEWSYDTSQYYNQKWVIAYTDGSVSKDFEEVTRNTRDYRWFISSLTPGQTYTVTIRSVVLNLTSDVQTLTVTAKPVVNTVLEEISTTNSSLTFGYTVKPSDIFDQFLFTVNPQQVDPVSRLKNESLTSVTINGLEGGMRYTLQAYTKSQSEQSSVFVPLEFITDPNPVPVQLTPKAREITLTFGAQQGGAAEYVISCSPDCGNQTVPSGSTDVTFPNLKPFSTYIFTVVTRTIAVGGQAKEVRREHEQRTSEAAPSKPQMLMASEKSIHSVTLRWRKPMEVNGILRHFIVSYRGQEENFPGAPVHQNVMTLSSTETSLPLHGLKAGYTYTFQVFARTVADGEHVEVKLTMKTASPTFKSNITPESSKPSEPDSGKKVTQKTISLKMVNPFSTEAGFVRYYTVIVSRDPDVDDSSSSLPSWEEAKNDKNIAVYQAVTRCEDFFTPGSSCGESGVSTSSSRKRRAVGTNDLLTREFVVGAETKAECDQGQGSCNGPLSEGTSYYIKLRGFTQSGQYQDTAYSEKIKTAEKESSSSGGIIGGVVGTIVALAVVAAIVFFVVFKRKRRPKKATKHAGPRTNWEHSTMNKFSRPVRLVQFPDHVRKMAADSDFKYAEEYEDLKEVGRDQPTLAAEFPPNRPKNRFTNILPYDHSRVKLLPTDDEEGSDYINANYMPGYNSKREYIATQGPLPATRDDFWRMLWEQCSRNIVMLTRCQEKGREKSDHYWPSDSEPKFYGDLQVVILNETHMPDWTIVEFKVSHGEQSRQVRHFHYRVWPDFGVPKDPASIIRFVRTVREKLIREGGPIVLHCSAGVGRSGTFIVLDHLLQLIREKEEVDVFSIVYKLRKERVLMVQTEQQYKFIHECLLCVLENREHDTTYANLGQINVGFEDDEGINLEGP